jgi:hypothetical protein
VILSDIFVTPKKENSMKKRIVTLLQTQVADLGNYTDTVLSVNGISYAELSFTTTSQGNLLKIQQDLLLNKGKEISLTYTDFASRFDQNADFIAIHASMTLY